jgi:hypothetical protein
MKNILLLIISISILSGQLKAQDANTEFIQADEKKDWGFSLTPYALLAAMSTDVGGEKIRQNFNDLSSITNFGFQLIGAVRYKKLSMTFDGTWATLGVNEPTGPIQLDVEIIQNIFDLKGGYLVYDKFEFSEGHPLRGWSLEMTTGGKYWKNDLSVNYDVVINDVSVLDGQVNEKQEWWDLMVGTKAKFVLNQSVYLGIWLNVGGFGIGNSSKWSQDFTYLNSFKVSNLLTVNAGFRNFKYRRVDGEPGNELETKVAVTGPLLGLSFVF